MRSELSETNQKWDLGVRMDSSMEITIWIMVAVKKPKFMLGNIKKGIEVKTQNVVQICGMSTSGIQSSVLGSACEKELEK